MTRAERRSLVPQFEERTNYGRKDTDPYSKLFEERIVFLGAPVDDISANDVTAQMLALEGMDPDRPISLYINSPGGSLTSMLAICDTMRYVRPEVETTCVGQAGSAAAVLLAAGSPDGARRCAAPGSCCTSPRSRCPAATPPTWTSRRGRCCGCARRPRRSWPRRPGGRPRPSGTT